MEPLVSIVIPCYNEENSIDHLLTSLTRQNICVEQLEIILVNDASTDSTYEKMLEWEKHYPDSILVINCEEHMGEAKARSLGMQYARGAYLSFTAETAGHHAFIRRHEKISRNFSMNVCFATNRKYVPVSMVMLYSLFCNNPDADIHVYVFHCELTEEDHNAFSLLAASWSQQVTLVDVPPQLFEKLPTTDCWSKETYFRLLMPALLPSNIERFLYLDVDVIINKSLREFYMMNFSGNDCIVCEDILMNRVHKSYYLENFEDLKDRSFTYFNAGIMLWNLRQVRENYHITTYIQTLIKYMPVLECLDQDILNVVHCGKTLTVPWQQYNLQISIAAQKHFPVDTVRSMSHIIHFCGPKPWDPNVNFEEYYHIKDSNFTELAQIWKNYEYALEQEYHL
ncbi:MAG: glycosyltransferase [Roseburia sp.]|nr:glycosyltransferase [Roseburia sp.]